MRGCGHTNDDDDERSDAATSATTCAGVALAGTGDGGRTDGVEKADSGEGGMEREGTLYAEQGGEWHTVTTPRQTNKDQKKEKEKKVTCVLS